MKYIKSSFDSGKLNPTRPILESCTAGTESTFGGSQLLESQQFDRKTILFHVRLMVASTLSIALTVSETIGTEGGA
jgi:hypothetical protein